MSTGSPGHGEARQVGMAPYTGVWLCARPVPGSWVVELFRPFVGEQYFDGERREAAPERALVFEMFPNAQDRAYYRQFRGRDAVLVELGDETYETDPEIYTNFRGVVRNYWSDGYRPETVKYLPLGYGDGFVWGPMRRSSERQYVWSFLGGINKSTRPDAVRAFASLEPHLLFTTDTPRGVTMWNQVEGKPRRYGPAENAAVLHDSIFSLCPMGNVNLDSFRVYESLEAGAIPIVEKRRRLDYFRQALGEHPMPTVRNWGEGAELAAALLANTRELDALQTRCVEWWKGFRQRYPGELGEFLARCSAHTAERGVGEYVVPGHASRWWKVRELLRHHDSRAVRRRVELTARRVLARKKLRVSLNTPAQTPEGE